MIKSLLCWICIASICGAVVSSSFVAVKSRKERQNDPNPPIKCNLPEDLKKEIANYKEVANRIINEATSGSFKGRVYDELAVFGDKFGHRLVGSAALEESIDYLVESMKTNGMNKSRKEEIHTRYWRRGPESLKMLQPREEVFSILSFGYSISTPLDGIEAEALVVTSFEDLASKADQARGKIVVFNQGFTSYPDGWIYRVTSAVEVAKIGGVAVLVRSVTPFSMDSPHTGAMQYEDGIEKIPSVAITVEAADMLLRMSKRGETIRLHLKVEAETVEDGLTHNAIGEITGRTIPNEIVILSGHIDSWDVGQGVVDDASGVFFSTEALNLLKHLNLFPKRTIEAIAWTCEEIGLQGALGFMETHKNEIGKYIAAFEADPGPYKPMGLDFAGGDAAGCVIQEILKLAEPINATTFRSYPVVGTDISLLTEKGVPSLGLSTDGFETDKYFWFQHSEADTMSALNSEELDLCLALWTLSSYVIADLSVSLTKLPDMNDSSSQIFVNTTLLTLLFATTIFRKYLL